MYEAIAADNIETVSSLIESGEFEETFISKVPPDSPIIMNQNPPLTCVAAYYGSLNCLQYFLDHGYDLFTPDKIFFLAIIKFSFFCDIWSFKNYFIYRLPTHFAAAGGQDAILPYLEDNCADFKAFDSITKHIFFS